MQKNELNLAVNVAKRQVYAVVKASGENILTYLQGQITQDIKNLSVTQALYAVVLNPQAKAVTDFYLIQTKKNEIMFLCPRPQAVALVERLKRFTLGYQLRIGMVSPWQVVSVQGENVDVFLAQKELPVPEKKALSVASSNDVFVLRMPEATNDGVWLIGGDIGVEANVDETVIERGRILKGNPLFGVDWDHKIHPLNANLIERNGVDFDKGCYVGQEVTSRMHWRGGIKKKLYRVRLSVNTENVPCVIRTTVKVGMLTSLAESKKGEYIGIAHLPIVTVDSGATLSLETGELIKVIGVSGLDDKEISES